MEFLQKAKIKFNIFILITILTSLLLIQSNFYLSDDSTTTPKLSLYSKIKNQAAFSDKKTTPLSTPYFSKYEMSLYTTNESFQGYQLFIVCRRNITGDNYDSFLVIVNLSGEIYKEKYLGNSPTVAYLPAKFINSSTILYGGLDGAHLWNIETDTDIFLNFRGHHDYEYNPNSNTIFTLNRYTLEEGGNYYYFDYIEEYTLDGSKIWSLDTRSFISPSMWCPYQDMVHLIPDITHSNTVFYDAEEDVIYYNARNVNTFYKIDHKTGAVTWGLGEYGNFTLYDKYGHLKENLFYHAHSVKKVANNTFILFDNDYHNETYKYDSNSRIVEISINETTMTAWESWTWEGGEEYYSEYWGDAQRLPNGNRLGTFGAYSHAGNAHYGARIVETNQEGKIVWKLDFINTAQYSYGVYRSQRVSFRPYIESHENEYVPINQDVGLKWKVHYGINVRMKLDGIFLLYQNGTIVNSGQFTFQPFMQTTIIQTDVCFLEEGFYNITLVISDADSKNNFTEEMIALAVPFHITRTGLTTVEEGNTDIYIRWSGFTSSVVDFKLIANNSLIESGEWTGEDIVFYSGNFSIGIYIISFLLYNNSALIYNDTFIFTVVAPSPPIFLSFPEDQAIIWNTSLTLSWQIYDTNPDHYAILINGKLYFTGDWVETNSIIFWKFPLLDEGVYNVTFAAYDTVNNCAFVTTFITVLSPVPPVISYTGPCELIWGLPTPIFLTWEVHGGNSWLLLKNGSLYDTGIVEDHSISIGPIYWRTEEWLPAKYNLTIIVVDESFNNASLTVFVSVVVKLSDPYADSYVPALTNYCVHPENALGPPDNAYAILYFDYGNGYIVLDMGENEEILNKEGYDFVVYAKGGLYKVSINNDLTKPFTDLGLAINDTYFDLQTVGFSKARYIRIEFQEGEEVLVDALKAINYNIIKVDSEPPKIITSPGNMTVYLNVSSTLLEWKAKDLTPFNYSIYVNSDLRASNPWNGDVISFFFEIYDVGTYIITLILFDVFGNKAVDTIVLTVLPIPVTHSTGEFVPIITTFANILVLVWLSLIWVREKNKR